HGNNNAYCQDNDVSWLQWDDADKDLLEFTIRLIRLRHAHPVFRRRRFFEGRSVHGDGEHDIAWYSPEGVAMSDEDWPVRHARWLLVWLGGDGIGLPGPYGETVVDDDSLLLLDDSLHAVRFTVPKELQRGTWREVIDAYALGITGADVDARRRIAVPGFTVQV